MTMAQNQTVRLTVIQLDSGDSGSPPFGVLAAVKRESIVRQVETTTPWLVSAAGAVVRELAPQDRIDRLLTAVERKLSTVPRCGVTILINRPTGLAFVAVWPWAEGGSQLHPTTQ
jgi:hypothetical protein